MLQFSGISSVSACSLRVHLEMTWQVSYLLVQSLVLPSSVLNALEACLLPCFEDDDGLCCCVLCHSLVPTVLYGKEVMGEG